MTWPVMPPYQGDCDCTVFQSKATLEGAQIRVEESGPYQATIVYALQGGDLHMVRSNVAEFLPMHACALLDSHLFLPLLMI